MVRNVADIYQSPQYVMAANKVRRAQGALNILGGAGSRPGYDTLQISDTARSFSKEYVVALVDTCTDVSASDFTYYFDNYNNMPALLDAINFSEGLVLGYYKTELKDLGVLSFKVNGVPEITAKNNTLVLKDKGYYCYTAQNGKNYAWSVNNGNIGWATSESMLEADKDISGYNYRWEMHRAGDLLSRLASGTSLYGFSKEEIKETLAGFGITEGHFTIDAGAGTQHYILLENGVVDFA